MKNYFDYLEENDKALFDAIINITPAHTFKVMLRRANEFEIEKSALRRHGATPSICPSCNGKLEKTPYNYVQCESCEKTYKQTEA